MGHVGVRVAECYLLVCLLSFVAYLVDSKFKGIWRGREAAPSSIQYRPTTRAPHRRRLT